MGGVPKPLPFVNVAIRMNEPLPPTRSRTPLLYNVQSHAVTLGPAPAPAVCLVGLPLPSQPSFERGKKS